MKWISKDFLYQPHVRKHLLLIPIGFLLGYLGYGFIHFNGFQNTWELLYTAILGICIAYTAYFSNAAINTMIPWRQQPGLRLLAGILIHTLLSAVLVYGTLWGYERLYSESSLFVEDTNDVLIKIGILLFCAALVYNVIYFAIYSYYHYSKGQLLALQLKRKQTQLQLNALKSQLSPHFLFNSMNTLSSLFQKDTEKAETFIRALGNSYEYVLNKYDDPLVTVGEELTFVNSYCVLIRTRFGEYLTLDLNLPAQVLESKIPPLTLQMLVENAVKHNVMGPSSPLTLTIGADTGKITVTNNKTAKRPKMESLRIGLRNIASRYELLTDKTIEVTDTDIFKVQLPIIT